MLFWTVEKLERRIRELAEYRYRDAIAMPEWSFIIDEENANGVGKTPERSGGSVIRKGDRWKGRDLYVWLTGHVVVPEIWQNRTVVGRFDFGKTGLGGNSGFESLLYLNGSPFQGVDSNHQEVFLPVETLGTEVEFCFRLWSGLEGGGPPQDQEHQLKIAELAWLDPAADDLFYTARAALGTVKLLAEDRPERQSLLKALDRAFLLIDWAKPGSEAFYASISAAAETLKKQMEGIQSTHPVTITAIGHTHIDVAWLWRLTHTREKAARSFSTVLRLMERFPDYVFLQTQPQLYAYIKSDYPEIYEQIKKRIKEGRWEAGGAMWLEADCNLTSGESLVRQILYGTRFFRDEFGVESTYLWLPDVFGYSWALPQILRKSGIDTFMTTKISWNQYNRMPHDTFRWRGIDGSEVLTHFVTTPEAPNLNEEWFTFNGWYTYNGMVEPYTVKGIWDAYRDKSVNQELLLSYGYGDGGGGVNREMLEMRRRMEQMPGLPRVVTGRADEYFEKLQHTFDDTDQYVHTWDGELYLEYHRGTYTSQAYNKRMNRKLELLYREAEWLQSLQAAVDGTWIAYPKNCLADGWQIILRNQFHDIIPGSSIPEVYADSRIEYAEAERLGIEVREQAAGSLATQLKDSFAVTVFNGASFERSDLAVIPVKAGWEEGTWKDGEERTLTAQRIGEQWQVYVEQIPSLGSKTIHFEPASVIAKTEQTPFVLKEGALTTPHYVIAWNEAGQLTSILDTNAKREVLAEGGRGNVLQVFEDKPKDFEAWDIDLYYQEKMREVTELTSVKMIQNGPLTAVIRYAYSYMDSVITQDMTVYKDSRRIDFVTKVEWHEHQQLLKVAFPVSVRSTEATYDIQFGNVKRPTHWNTSWDFARFETVGHQWADLSERAYGVSLLNDCKYGYDIKDNVMRLSLIKSATYPDPQADQGEHEFTYALLPHTGDWVEGGTVQAAWALNNPLFSVSGAVRDSGKSLFRLNASNVRIDAVKKAEDRDAVVVRMHEFTGATSYVQLTSDYRIATWQESDLMERPISALQEDAAINFSLKPYEIKTFIVTINHS